MAGRPVSVIIPAFNAEDFLAEAVASVVGQPHRPLEVIIVDDGSTDGTLPLARSLAEAHGEVKVVSHPGGENRGLPATRNLGIQHASGDLIGFLDADDVWLPGKLEHQLEAMARHPEAGVCAAPSLFWFSWTGRANDAALDHVRGLDAQLDTLHRPPELLVGLLNGSAAPTMSSLLVRREVFERAGGFEEAMPMMFEDQVWLAKAFLHVPVYLGPEPLDRYRQHRHALTARAGQSRADLYPGTTADRARFLRWLEGFLDEQGVTDPVVREALERALEPVRRPVAYLIAHPGQLVRTLTWRLLPARLRRWIWRQVRRLRHRWVKV